MTSQGTWDGGLYAENSAHHRDTDERLIADLALDPDARVLDLGCGHGDLTARIAALVPAGQALGLDASGEMVATARGRHRAANLTFEHRRAQDLAHGTEPGSFDAVVSVACLHWIPREDHPGVLSQIASLLRPGGVLRVDFGGCGQIAAPRVLLDEESAALGGPTDPWFFPMPEDYRPLLEGAGLSVDKGYVRLLHQRRSFPDAASVTGMMRSQTYMAYDGAMSAQDRAIFHARADARISTDLLRHDGTYDLDFVRIDVLAHRTR